MRPAHVTYVLFSEVFSCEKKNLSIHPSKKMSGPLAFTQFSSAFFFFHVLAWIVHWASGFPIALVANGVPVIPVQPYTHTLVDLLTWAPIAVMASFEASMVCFRRAPMWKTLALVVHCALWGLLLACFVMLVGPAGYFDPPEPLTWKVEGSAIRDVRERAFAAQFNDVMCRAQVLETCRTGTLSELNVLLPQAQWPDDHSMRSIADLCRPDETQNATGASSHQSASYCVVCADVAPLADPATLVSRMSQKTTNDWSEARPSGTPEWRP